MISYPTRKKFHLVFCPCDIGDFPLSVGLGRLVYAKYLPDARPYNPKCAAFDRLSRPARQCNGHSHNGRDYGLYVTNAAHFLLCPKAHCARDCDEWDQGLNPTLLNHRPSITPNRGDLGLCAGRPHGLVGSRWFVPACPPAGESGVRQHVAKVSPKAFHAW